MFEKAKMPYQLVRVWWSNSNCKYNYCVGDIHSTCPASAVSTICSCEYHVQLWVPCTAVTSVCFYLGTELLTAILMIRYARSFTSHSTSDKSLPTSKKSCQSRPPMTTWSMRAKPWRLFVTTTGCCTTWCPTGRVCSWLTCCFTSIHPSSLHWRLQTRQKQWCWTPDERPPCLHACHHPAFKTTLFTELRPPRF